PEQRAQPRREGDERRPQGLGQRRSPPRHRGMVQPAPDPIAQNGSISWSIQFAAQYCRGARPRNVAMVPTAQQHFGPPAWRSPMSRDLQKSSRILTLVLLVAAGAYGCGSSGGRKAGNTGGGSEDGGSGRS